MSSSRFIVVSAVALIAAAALLALGAVVQVPGLAIAGMAFVLLVLGAREAWLWEGAGRLWLLMALALVGVVVIAFAASKVFA